MIHSTPRRTFDHDPMPGRPGRDRRDLRCCTRQPGPRAREVRVPPGRDRSESSQASGAPARRSESTSSQLPPVRGPALRPGMPRTAALDSEFRSESDPTRSACHRLRSVGLVTRRRPGRPAGRAGDPPPSRAGAARASARPDPRGPAGPGRRARASD